mmetsp:Transcript_24990/g.58128  ORF Transcript_24990/g.58128 Transcript_24990/m.58128 type:complete len:325 (-) Transcript_24990:287-1261(-)
MDINTQVEAMKVELAPREITVAAHHCPLSLRPRDDELPRVPLPGFCFFLLVSRQPSRRRHLEGPLQDCSRLLEHHTPHRQAESAASCQCHGSGRGRRRAQGGCTYCSGACPCSWTRARRTLHSGRATCQEHHWAHVLPAGRRRNLGPARKLLRLDTPLSSGGYRQKAARRRVLPRRCACATSMRMLVRTGPLLCNTSPRSCWQGCSPELGLRGHPRRQATRRTSSLEACMWSQLRRVLGCSLRTDPAATRTRCARQAGPAFSGEKWVLPQHLPHATGGHGTLWVTRADHKVHPRAGQLHQAPRAREFARSSHREKQGLASWAHV